MTPDTTTGHTAVFLEQASPVKKLPPYMMAGKNVTYDEAAVQFRFLNGRYLKSFNKNIYNIYILSN